MADSSDATLPAESIEEAAEQVAGPEEGRVIGHVKWQVYTAYMKAVGVGMVALVLLSLALMQVSSYDCPVDSVLLSLDLLRPCRHAYCANLTLCLFLHLYMPLSPHAL